MTTHELETTGGDIVYDVRGPRPTADGRPPLFMIGQPMDAITAASWAPSSAIPANRKPSRAGCARS
jgi:hypothetical protein